MPVCDLSDSDLLAQLKSGSSEAYQAIYDRYYDRLLRLMQGKYKQQNAYVAEESVQHAFMLLWQKSDTIEHLKAWLYQNVEGEALHIVRREKRHSQNVVRLNNAYSPSGTDGDDTSSDRYEIADDSPSPEEIASDNEQAAILRQCLPPVAPADREVIQAMYFEGMSGREAAVHLGISYQDVKVSIRRIKRVISLGFDEKMSQTRVAA